MEATNKHQIIRIEIVRDFDSTYYANLYDSKGCSHNLSKEYTDYRTMKSLCKHEYGVSLPNLSELAFERHGRKSYAYISAETTQISTETAKVERVSGDGEKAVEIEITSISQLNVLKYKLKHPDLKKWAVYYGLLWLVRRMYYLEEVWIESVRIDNKFRQSLCENDKAIIAAVRRLIAQAEIAA